MSLNILNITILKEAQYQGLDFVSFSYIGIQYKPSVIISTQSYLSALHDVWDCVVLTIRNLCPLSDKNSVTGSVWRSDRQMFKIQEKRRTTDLNVSHFNPVRKPWKGVNRIADHAMIGQFAIGKTVVFLKRTGVQTFNSICHLLELSSVHCGNRANLIYSGCMIDPNLARKERFGEPVAGQLRRRQPADNVQDNIGKACFYRRI